MIRQVFFGIAALALIAGPVASQQEPKKDTCTVVKGKPCCNMPTKRPIAKPVKPAPAKKP